MKPSDGDKAKSPSWFYAMLPAAIATGPVGTLIQLYVLELHGSVLDVGLVTSVFNAVSIPAAIIWGYVTDRFHNRKAIVAASSLAISGNLILLLLLNTISGVAILYGLFSLLTAASATPLNLLVMETSPKSHWATAFARFSMVSSIGNTIGFLIGSVWPTLFPLQLLVVPLSLLSAASAILSVILIREPSFVFEGEIIAMQKRSFYQRLLVLPLVFLRVPGATDFRAVFKGLRYQLTGQLPILYFSIFAFYFSSGVFNTSLTPSLKVAGSTEGEIFLVSLLGVAVQTASFYFAGPYIERRTLRVAALGGLALRAVCYGLIGLGAAFLTGTPYLATTLGLYPLASGLAFATYYTASNTMVFNMLGAKRQGSRLGVYSALVGVAVTVGSLVSGFTSFYLGFAVTFVVSALALVLAAALTSLISDKPSG
ncbi:MAG: MFS transporter [Thaumarchaeota archaeon]|nr:MFS transporter [Nitrososphaerota archaeon]